MRQLNGVFTQSMNRKHCRVGHLFQGRYKAILVDKEAYLLELSRYIVLNPVRAKMVDCPAEWLWSNWHCMVGKEPSPNWLSVEPMLLLFSSDRKQAVSEYVKFVHEGVGIDIWDNLQHQKDLTPLSPPSANRPTFPFALASTYFTLNLPISALTAVK